MHRGPKHLHISEECVHGEVKRRKCSHSVVRWRVVVVPCEDVPTCHVALKAMLALPSYSR